MSQIELLRHQVSQAAQSSDSEDLLREALQVLESKIEYVTPEQEEGIGKGLADIAAGRVITFEEWKLKSRALIEELKEKEAARNAA